jgi:putative ABC transport system substrate-binding protein
MSDPVGAGQVKSLSHPDRNLTGLSWQTVDTATKRFELAIELRPKLKTLGVMFDSSEAAAQAEAEALRRAAEKVGVETVLLGVRRPEDIGPAFAGLKDRLRAGVLIAVDSPMTTGQRKQIATHALQSRIPMISEGRVFAEAGGVLTYGAELTDLLRRGADYVDKLLKGAKVAELPISQPTAFELVVNLRSAQAVGIKVPASIVERADKVLR